MIERNPSLYALLQDGINRFHQAPPTASKPISINFSVHQADSCNLDEVLSIVNPIIEKVNNVYNNNTEMTPLDIVVCVDPMYPQGFVGNTASVQKPTQVLHRLVGKIEGSDDLNNRGLWRTALSIATSRIIVKRPLKAEPFLNMSPHSSVKGTSQRLDVYFPKIMILPAASRYAEKA